MFLIASAAQAFGDRAEIADEELLEVPEARFEIIAVPALFGDLAANLFGIAFEPSDLPEIPAIELSPFCPQGSKDSARYTRELLLSRRHYR